MSAAPRITIIMRTKNSDWVVAQALAALFSQDFTDFELLVVDSGSTDRTLTMVEHYPCRLMRIPPQNYVPGAVLNDAIAQTESELIVFLNSDTVLLSPQSLKCLVRAFDDPAVQAAFGRQIPRPEADTWVRRDYRIAFPEKGEAPEWLTLSLPVAAMRRSIWEQHRFYTDAWGSEDTEWGHWARRQGHRVAYVPEAIAMHSHNYTFRQMYGRRFIEGEADAFIYHKAASLGGFVSGCLSAAGRELIEHVRVRDIAGLLSLAPRICSGQWGYFQGLRLGSRRRRTGDTNVQIGQQTVLSRHESVRSQADKPETERLEASRPEASRQEEMKSV
jgi:rhamnosyltransferase